MTQSGSTQDRPSAVDQEEIWESPEQAAQTSLPPDESPAQRGSGGQSPAWAQSLTSTAPVPGPAGFYFADVPNRIIAFIIDLIVLAVAGMIISLVIGGIFGGLTTPRSLESAGGDLNVGAFLVVAIAQLAISFAYFGYCWVALRGTAGMKMLGLQIGDESDGHSVSWNQALVRWLILGIPSILATFAVFVPSVLGVVLTIIGVIWLVVLLYTIAQSPTKQGLHDRYARTILVKAGRRAA